jgi:hypothetical protein
MVPSPVKPAPRSVRSTKGGLESDRWAPSNRRNRRANPPAGTR